MQTAKPEGQERGRCCKTDTHTHSNEHTRAYPSPAPSLPSLWPMTKTGETYTQKMMNTRFHPQSDRISLSLSLFHNSEYVQFIDETHVRVCLSKPGRHSGSCPKSNFEDDYCVRHSHSHVRTKSTSSCTYHRLSVTCSLS